MAIIRRQENVTGTIQAINGNIIKVLLNDMVSGKKPCFSESKGCDSGCGACSGIENNKTLTIYTPQAPNYAVNMEITFNYRSIHDTLMLIMAFGIPCLSAAVVALLWLIHAPSLIESRLSIMSITGAFCGGFVILWLLDILLRRRIPAQIISPPVKK
ncbi:MAG: hypothetical protein ACM31E_11285 [Fibrobacterota bacterium]